MTFHKGAGNWLGVVLLVVLATALTEARPTQTFEIRRYILVAANLPNHDKSGQPRDTSDPFLQVWNVRDGTVGDELYRTPTQDNTLNPVFQFEIDFNPEEVYIFTIRDHDPINPDDALGHVVIPAGFLVGPVYPLESPAGGTIQIMQLT